MELEVKHTVNEECIVFCQDKSFEWLRSRRQEINSR